MYTPENKNTIGCEIKQRVLEAIKNITVKIMYITISDI